MWKKKYDKDNGLWVLSSPVAFKPGYECIIVCATENEANNVNLRLSNGDLKIPTENSEGYEELHQFEILKPTRVFRPK